jgi:methylenetetrahydrofolate dehydrogenase (NADP+) / methenyltetrahydrofolate cyclohydrolase
MILSGTKIAKNIYKELREKVILMPEKPKLQVILVWENSPSMRYIKQKKKWCDFIGYEFELKEFWNQVSEAELIKCIESSNQDISIHGILVQTPLPAHIYTQKILNSIDPKKDVDWFHPYNQGKVVIGDKSGLEPCTPAGIIELISHVEKSIGGKYIVIVGRSNIVGKPLANMCINLGATVSICNSQTKDLIRYTKKADILIVATGKPKLISKDMIKEEALIIDVGFSVVDGKIWWDCDFDIIQKTHTITPNPGWIWPMTVSFLMKNILKAYYLQK